MASIVKRKNRYSVVYTYKDDDGNQHQKWETFDTNADAKKRKTQIEFEHRIARIRVLPQRLSRKHFLFGGEQAGEVFLAEVLEEFPEVGHE